MGLPMKKPKAHGTVREAWQRRCRVVGRLGSLGCRQTPAAGVFYFGVINAHVCAGA